MKWLHTGQIPRKWSYHYPEHDYLCLWCLMYLDEFQRWYLARFIRPVARVGSGDPVRVLCLYTINTLDEACNIYC